MRKTALKKIALGILLAGIVSVSAEASTESLILQAREANLKRFQFALQNGARVIPTPDNQSFYLLWYPKDIQPGAPLIVTLHGHGSFAFDEFALWQPFAQQYGFGILALQWWFGKGENPEDYYAPKDMYPILEEAIKKEGTFPGNVLLHGFSRGASNIYALGFLDRSRTEPFFGLIVANSGGLTENYPPNQEMLAQGDGALNGTHWALYCGANDPYPERDGCPAMERTREQLQALGGTVDLLLKDEGAGHGGFHQDPSAIAAVMDQFKPNSVKIDSERTDDVR